MKYFFEIAYNGKPYHGWQRQNNASSVQQVVEETFSTIYRQEIEIIGSGRTDTGVHCKQQFFHSEIPETITDKSLLLYKLNSLLPDSIAINNIYSVSDGTHARFDAIERHYEYIITTTKNPFMKDLALPYYKPLDLETMNEAAALMLGERDFQSFSKVKTDVNTFICRIFVANWSVKNDLLLFNITGNRFLRGMVRAIVGTLIEVGKGKINTNDFENIILAKNRKHAGMAVPPEGLYLTKVIYPQGHLKNI